MPLSLQAHQVRGGARREPVRRKLTISVDEDVYRGLQRVVGRRHISRFLNDLARPHVVPGAREEGYRAMAADEEREREAIEWIQGLADIPDEPS
jgi:predicted CopG family antitoxin